MKLPYSYKLLILLTITCFSISGKSQTKDTVQLLEFKLLEKKTATQPAFKQTIIDSTAISQYVVANLSQLLSVYSPVFIKSYGQGSLATASFRGTAASHTQVNWNGILLNSPTLGMQDFSVIPVSFTDDISILHGAGSLINRNGGLGGSIQLDNGSTRTNGFHLDAKQYAGSFNDYRSYIKTAYGNGKWQGSSRIQYHSAENNFPYLNVSKEDRPVEIQGNAQTQTLQLFQEGYRQFGDKGTLAARAWYTDNHRNIPPVLTQGISRAWLSYKAMRSMLEWKSSPSKKPGQGSATNYILRSAYLHDQTNYMDSLKGLNSNHQTHTYRNQFRLNHSFSTNLLLRTGADYDFEFARSDGYESQKLRQRKTANAFADFSSEPLKGTKLNLHLREVLTDEKFSPLIYALGAEQKLFKKIPVLIKGNFSRNFNMPSLHDLYWNPGGNPDLKPEDGWTAESGLALPELRLLSSLLINGEFTLFYSKIQDWILWSPGGQGYWQPQNLLEVHSRGMESSVNIRLKVKKYIIESRASYAFTRATNEKTRGPNDASAGKQLIYVPAHNFQSFLRASRKGYALTYEMTYTGTRFITNDNSWYMPSFLLSNVTFGKNYQLKNYRFNLQLEINNIMNKQFQAIANYPMPGRYYGVMLGLGF